MLQQWINLLRRFNDKKPLSKSLINEIEQFFTNYWRDNKLNAFQKPSDLEYLRRLPESLIDDIIIEYLFKDFKYKYKNYLFPRN